MLGVSKHWISRGNGISGGNWVSGGKLESRGKMAGQRRGGRDA